TRPTKPSGCCAISPVGLTSRPRASPPASSKGSTRCSPPTDLGCRSSSGAHSPAPILRAALVAHATKLNVTNNVEAEAGACAQPFYRPTNVRLAAPTAFLGTTTIDQNRF